MAIARFSINDVGTNKRENLAQMVQRYKLLAEPRTVNEGLLYFTLRQDWKLYKMLKQDPSHPKDTGLLQESWIPPAKIKQIQLDRGDASSKVDSTFFSDIRTTSEFSQYRMNFMSGKFNVYVLNKATVGEQARRKRPLGPKRIKKFSGRHNLKRYLPWVDARTHFYSKKLRIVRQQLDKEWKQFVPQFLEFKIYGEGIGV